MYLIDTSVFVNYFKGIETSKTKLFEEILDEGLSFGLSSLTYMELLQGAYDQREYKKLDDYLSTQIIYPLRDSFYKDAAHAYFQCRKKGITIRSSIDMLIAITARENDLILISEDADFTRMKPIVKFKYVE